MIRKTDGPADYVSMPDGTTLKRCPTCFRLGYRPGHQFHWCGEQCLTCGQDLEKPVAKLRLPIPYRNSEGEEWECLGWEDGNPSTGRAVVRAIGSDNRTILGVNSTISLFERLEVDPEKVPGKKKRVEVVGGREWERFERLKESLEELDELSWQLFTNWRNHIEYIRQCCGFYDDDESLEEMDDLCRRIPGLVRYVSTGHFASMETDEEWDLLPRNGACYTNRFSDASPKVHVSIEDISTGEL